MGYEVKSGDSLWKIAKEQCGAKSNAEIQQTINEIVNLNKDKIKDPNLIFDGDKLKLPGDVFENSAAQPKGANTGTKAENNEAGNEEAAVKDKEEGLANAEIISTVNTQIFDDFQNWLKGFKGARQDREDAVLSEDKHQIDNAETQYQADVRDMDTKFDFKHKGSIDAGLKSLAKGIIETYGNGETITFEGFARWYKGQLTNKEMNELKEDDLQKVFSKIDENRNGKLDASEVEKMFKAIDSYDANADGRMGINAMDSFTFTHQLDI